VDTGDQPKRLSITLKGKNLLFTSGAHVVSSFGLEVATVNAWQLQLLGYVGPRGQATPRQRGVGSGLELDLKNMLLNALIEKC
jgi:hypothetical protein